MSDYTQLSQGQRYQMEALLKAGHNQIKIATVCRQTNVYQSRYFLRDTFGL